jgi:hypothetical protein
VECEVEERVSEDLDADDKDIDINGDGDIDGLDGNGDDRHVDDGDGNDGHV